MIILAIVWFGSFLFLGLNAYQKPSKYSCNDQKDRAFKNIFYTRRETKIAERVDAPFGTGFSKLRRQALFQHSSSPDGVDEIKVPQSWVSAMSNKEDFEEAVTEAVLLAKAMLPPDAKTDLCLVYFSSIYSNMQPVQAQLFMKLEALVPDVQAYVGCSAAGLLGCLPGSFGRASEVENRVAVSVTLASLPNIKIQPFFLKDEDVPSREADDAAWRKVIGLEIDTETYDPKVPPVFITFPSAAFINKIQSFLSGIDYAYPGATQVGAIASTVSSLSRAAVFAKGKRAENDFASGFSTEGVAGVALYGDIVARSLICQGSTPIGDVFEIDKCEGGVIRSIRNCADKKFIGPAYPPLYEVAQLKKTVSDRERGLMQRNLLVGLSTNGMGNTVQDLIRLASMETKDIPFTVYKVASVDMKTGAMVVPTKVEPSQKLRFFVRDRDAATSDLESSLMKLKLVLLQNSLKGSSNRISGALVFPSMDRGKLLFDADNYESKMITNFINAPMGGFFCNGVIGAFPGYPTSLYGSSTIITLLFPVSGSTPAGTYNTQSEASDFPAPTEDEEVVVRRKDPLTARPLKTGQVEFSVVERLAQPKNRLEEITWEKDAEVERSREFLPLKTLAYQAKLYMEDKRNTPIDVVAAIKAASSKPLPIIAECKKSSPAVGVLREEYNPVQISREYEAGGAVAVAVHCDRKYFGGSLQDMADVKECINLPVICSDFIITPYQIYKSRISGADAIQLISSILPETDLPYFHKIARALGMQVIVCVSSTAQLERALTIPGLQIISIVNRNYVDWTPSDKFNRIMTDELRKKIKEAGIIVIAEGGIGSRLDVQAFVDYGVDALMVGSSLLRQVSPGSSIKDLLGVE